MTQARVVGESNTEGGAGYANVEGKGDKPHAEYI